MKTKKECVQFVKDLIFEILQFKFYDVDKEFAGISHEYKSLDGFIESCAERIYQEQPRKKLNRDEKKEFVDRLYDFCPLVGITYIEEGKPFRKMFSKFIFS